MPSGEASGVIPSKTIQGQSFLTCHPFATFHPRRCSFQGDTLWNVSQHHYNIGTKPVGFSLTKFTFLLRFSLSDSIRKIKKVKMWIYIARFMRQAPLTRIRHWNWPAKPLFRSPPSLQTQPGQQPNNWHRSASQLVGLHLRNPSLMDYYSFKRPRRDGWLSWPCWLTDSGRFTQKVVTRPAASLAQDRESSPARTGGLTTMPRHQLYRHHSQERIKRKCGRKPWKYTDLIISSTNISVNSKQLSVKNNCSNIGQ